MDLRWGFYGKLPSQGDFVSRRLGWEFTEPWDEWMQAGLATARQAPDGQWLQHYLSAPVWRFRLAPGVAGAAGWLGLWFPSVDRVGRHFPLTVAAPLPQGRGTHAALAADDGSWQALEDSALAALDPRTSLDQLEQRLSQAPTPVAEAEPPTDGQARAGLQVKPLADDADAGAAQQACNELAAQAVLFFSWGSQAVPPTVVAAPTLPAAEWFGGFLHGRWSDGANLG